MLTRAQKKYIRSLQQKKFRNQFGRFVAEGPKVVEELRASSFQIEDVFGLEEYHGRGHTPVSGKDLGMISGLKTPNEVLAVAHIPEAPQVRWEAPLILALDGVRDPGNLGTILRLAEWFGLRQIVLSADCAEPWNPKVVQSAMGSLFRLSVVQTELGDLLGEGRNRGFQLLGADMNGTSIQSFHKPEKMILVMGSESWGLRPDVKAHLTQNITIPQNGRAPIDSLNVATATGILLSHLSA